MDIRLQLVFLWIAVAFYAGASSLFIGSLVFNKSNLTKLSVIITVVGFVSHSVSLILRWIQVGHGPYMTFYEVTSSDAWVAILVYLLFQVRFRNMRFLGAIIIPVSFLLIGLGVMSSTKVESIPQTFKTFWLFVHIFFGKLTYGLALLGFGMAVVYLLRHYFPVRGERFFSKLPDNNQLDDASYRMFSFAFLVIGIMIAAGSIWANQAWGRYWGWDPVETWSLISWMLIGLYLHLRIVHGWRGVRAAWVLVTVFLVIVFAIFGVVYFYHSIHSEYLK